MKIRLWLIICVMICAALCSCTLPGETVTENAERLYSDLDRSFDGRVMEKAFGKHISGKTQSVSEAQADILRGAVKDIRINGSRFALPVMVCDIPEEFSVRTDGKEPLNISNFRLQTGSLVCAGEDIADVTVLRHNRTDDAHGVIISMSMNSDKCGWRVGGADLADGERLERIFGKPSSDESLVTEDYKDYSYFSDRGDAAVFFSSTNSVMVFSMDCSALAENKELCGYSPYDDFSGLPDIPDISRDNKFVAINALGSRGVVMGDFSCPANIKKNELSGDVGLIFSGCSEYSNNPKYVCDSYTVYYKGKKMGFAETLRKKDDPPEEAPLYAWYLFAPEELPCPAAVAGIPCTQDIREAAEICGSYSVSEKGVYVLYGLGDSGNQAYDVMYCRTVDGISALYATPMYIEYGGKNND